MAWPGGRLKHKSSASLGRHLDAEQRAVLLAAEDVGVAWAAAGDRSRYREFDRQRRVELDVIGDAAVRDIEYPAHRRARQRAAVAYPLVIGTLGEDHIEGDPVDPGILAADRLGDLGERPSGHQAPASVRKAGNSSSGSSSRKLRMIVQR